MTLWGIDIPLWLGQCFATIGVLAVVYSAYVLARAVLTDKGPRFFWAKDRGKRK